MKISASVYSSKKLELLDLVQELDALNIDSLHVDCFDETFEKVMLDMKSIRKTSNTPIDFHAITTTPSKFFDWAIADKIEQLTFQLESIKEEWHVPTNFKGKLGISIVSDTPLEALLPYQDDLDFILLMTTQPGVSGGVFAKESFQKVMKARRLFPNLSVHVDGGINAEVSFILRLLGVDSAVSGSFLVNHSNIAYGLSELRFHQTASSFTVADFMMDKEQLPILDLETTLFSSAITTMDDYAMGFVLFQKSGALAGVCSNADLRKGIIKNLTNLNKMEVQDIVNVNPVTVKSHQTISEMMDIIKSKSFPILFLPVVDSNGKIAGAVLFNQLIRGEG